MKKKPATIADLWAHYAKHHLPRTRSAWRSKIAWGHMAKAFGHLPPDAITTDKISHYCDWRFPTSGSTINRELSTLAAIIAHGRKHGLTTAAPYIQRRPPTAPKGRVLTHEEVQSLLTECQSDKSLLLYVQLALLTAQRREAIIGLKWKQVNWGTKVVDFNEPSAFNQHRMKGRGVVPITKELEQVLGSVGAGLEFMINEAFVISAWGGDLAKLSRPFRLACGRAKLYGVTPHTLRHTVATDLVRKGVPLIEVSRLLGHKSVTTTEKNYLSLTPDFIAQAAMQLTLK